MKATKAKVASDEAATVKIAADKAAGAAAAAAATAAAAAAAAVFTTKANLAARAGWCRYVLACSPPPSPPGRGCST